MARPAAWAEIERERDRLALCATSELFARDSERVAHCTLHAAGLWLDYSRQHIDAEGLDALRRCAQTAGLTQAVRAMFAGEPVNVTEQRPALHVALRQPRRAAIGGAAIESAVLAERSRMLGLAEDLRNGRLVSATGRAYTDVVNIGIGGSDLGPAMALRALRPYAVGGPRVHCVGNIDGVALHDLLAELDPQSTLFVVTSKSFKTEETLSNAARARQWIETHLGAAAVARQFVGVSVDASAMTAFGIAADLQLHLWDWVGGRYSLWSSVGFPLAVAIGRVHFEALLAGAHRMDLHFRDAALPDNIPVQLGLLGFWNINFEQRSALAVLPYDSRLARFPAFLQQLDMESNGKSVSRHGLPIDYDTAPVVFGEPGNEAQHSFFQALHQGTVKASLDIIVDASASDATVSHALAQAEAFLYGVTGASVPPEKRQPGGRPVNVLMYAKLEPSTLGALVAAYEHKVFVQSLLWDINAFDQFGVELGKRMAKDVQHALQAPEQARELSASLRGSLANLARVRAGLGLSLIAWLAFTGAPRLAQADPWLAPGDPALRQDIQLLADAGIIRAPVMTWPMSWPDIARDVLAAPSSAAVDPVLENALARVQRAARDAAITGPGGLELRAAAAASPTPLRTFADSPREEGEVGAALSFMSERFAGRVQVTAVANPQDDRAVRFDGSYLGVNVGNFMVSAGYMQRWWGPGSEGSLILGTNARPIPSFTVERNYTDAFESPWLRWIGPWRASLAIGKSESADTERDGALLVLSDTKFLAARVNFRPRPWIDIALTRTAQFCGANRRCNLSTFRDLLLGHDNRSARLSLAAEPGNQMAGYDLRLTSPWKGFPVAGYAQFIGEDEANGLPSKFLGLLGAEFWGVNALGNYRLHAEYADTTCAFTRQNPFYDCAYRNPAIFPQGYTFRGRIIGHPLDNDGQMVSVGGILVRPDGDSWNVLLRRAELNRGGHTPDLAHALSASPATVRNLEIQYNRPLDLGRWGRGRMRFGVGFDSTSGPVSDRADVRGFLEWQQGL